MPSLPPPNITIKSRIATARCPCLGLGLGPDGSLTHFHFIEAAMLFTSSNFFERKIEKKNISRMRLIQKIFYRVSGDEGLKMAAFAVCQSKSLTVKTAVESEQTQKFVLPCVHHFLIWGREGRPLSSKIH